MYKTAPLICLMVFAALAISAISAQESNGIMDAANNTSQANESNDTLSGHGLNASSTEPIENPGISSPGSGFALGKTAPSKPNYSIESNSGTMTMYNISKYSNTKPLYNIEKFSHTLPTYNMSTPTKPGVRVDEWPFVCDIV
ncbi:MAG TPA: hypothetical protein VN455_04165 [Methanotrichaceae archaeon]|nr:hypothetical protein [Methanotrichaceae archaeon]